MSLLVSLLHFLNSNKDTEKRASMHSLKFQKKKKKQHCSKSNLIGRWGTKTVTLASSFHQLEGSYTILQGFY